MSLKKVWIFPKVFNGLPKAYGWVVRLLLNFYVWSGPRVNIERCDITVEPLQGGLDNAVPLEPLESLQVLSVPVGQVGGSAPHHLSIALTDLHSSRSLLDRNLPPNQLLEPLPARRYSEVTPSVSSRMTLTSPPTVRTALRVADHLPHLYQDAVHAGRLTPAGHALLLQQTVGHGHTVAQTGVVVLLRVAPPPAEVLHAAAHGGEDQQGYEP